MPRCIIDVPRTNAEIHAHGDDSVAGWTLCGRRAELEQRVPKDAPTYEGTDRRVINPHVLRYYHDAWRADLWLTHARESNAVALCGGCAQQVLDAIGTSRSRRGFKLLSRSPYALANALQRIKRGLVRVVARS